MIQSNTPQLLVELIPDADQGGFTARLPDIPAYGEGETADEAIADLQDALRGYIETFGIENATQRLVCPETRQVSWNLEGLARA